jgi:hypothetical protein
VFDVVDVNVGHKLVPLFAFPDGNNSVTASIATGIIFIRFGRVCGGIAISCCLGLGNQHGIQLGSSNGGRSRGRSSVSV